MIPCTAHGRKNPPRTLFLPKPCLNPLAESSSPVGAVQRRCGAGWQEGLPCFAGGASRLLPAEHPSSVPGQYQTPTNPLLHTAAAGANLKLLLRREATEPGCGCRALSRWGGQREEAGDPPPRQSSHAGASALQRLRSRADTARGLTCPGFPSSSAVPGAHRVTSVPGGAPAGRTVGPAAAGALGAAKQPPEEANDPFDELVYEPRERSSFPPTA